MRLAFLAEVSCVLYTCGKKQELCENIAPKPWKITPGRLQTAGVRTGLEPSYD